ncbi:Crp/Fnr family transcriptional regulator [Mucilaginibacter sp. KACC 22063]|uniref:Crp/Fnr family transcriptional regulator n=1 Tax=Mucilaginibacter sp. KACC 22063 TaxID=3025666 RepID=UPI0023653DFA|nr:Crp/Fnr family transcriptional regulator [Mucilaginibacter sp. KACC 22063]WDF56718.1 Crp/Fnr family transcriptional regulator [Mucilaginibacter sp. KACC 22063]
MQDLKSYIASKVSVNEDDLHTIISKFHNKSLRKGELLLKRGQVATNYYYLAKGALRFYYDQEQELTAWIVQPGEFFTEISSLNPELPTRFNIEAVENAELYSINKRDMEILYQAIPAWQEFGRKTWEAMAIRMIDEIIRFQTMSVEERYLEFLKKPGFMQLVSVKQLASYLGITPNALSRIRKNLR